MLTLLIPILQINISLITVTCIQKELDVKMTITITDFHYKKTGYNDIALLHAMSICFNEMLNYLM
jgi:hypothetical protein